MIVKEELLNPTFTLDHRPREKFLEGWSVFALESQDVHSVEVGHGMGWCGVTIRVKGSLVGDKRFLYNFRLQYKHTEDYKFYLTFSKLSETVVESNQELVSTEFTDPEDLQRRVGSMINYLVGRGMAAGA